MLYDLAPEGWYNGNLCLITIASAIMREFLGEDFAANDLLEEYDRIHEELGLPDSSHQIRLDQFATFLENSKYSKYFDVEYGNHFDYLAEVDAEYLDIDIAKQKLEDLLSEDDKGYVFGVIAHGSGGSGGVLDSVSRSVFEDTDSDLTGHFISPNDVTEDYVVIINPFDNEKQSYDFDMFIGSVNWFGRNNVLILEYQYQPGYYLKLNEEIR